MIKMPPLTKDEFSTVLTTAVEQHARSYAQSFSLHLCWQDDDTAAQSDYTSFASFLDTFGFRSAEKLELARDDTMPGWTTVQKLSQILQAAEAAGSNGRSIVFFHYAGHGSKGANDQLYLNSPSGSKSFCAEGLFGIIGAENSLLLQDDSPVDVVCIMDCCYSHLATRAPRAVGRVFEILAAVDANDPAAFTPGKRVSFSRKLAGTVRWLKSQNFRSVDLAEVMAQVRADSPVKKPTHVVRIGASSVRLHYPGSVSTKVSMGTPKLRAVFHVDVDQSFTPDELKVFLRWVHSLNPAVGLSLECVYETNSMCLILQASYAVFVKLNGLPGIGLICETTEVNRLAREITAPTAVGPSARDPNIPRVPSTAENIGPRK